MSFLKNLVNGDESFECLDLVGKNRLSGVSVSQATNIYVCIIWNSDMPAAKQMLLPLSWT